MKGKITFNKDCSPEYKDLVIKFLVQNPDDRIPLVKIFIHPWVLFFQEKYNIKRDNSSESDENTSSVGSIYDDENYDDELN